MAVIIFSDSSIAIKTGGCFPAEGTVVLSSGERTTMSELSVGDSVLAVDTDGSAIYSTILLFLDVARERHLVMYTIFTADGKALTLTPGHLVYVASGETSPNEMSPRDSHPIFASRVREGDFVFVLDSHQRWQVVRVQKVEVSMQRGLYAPLTQHGNMLVDGVLVSCYAMIDNVDIAHWSFAPLRLIHYLSASLWGSHVTHNATIQDGVHWYADALYTLGEYVISKNMWYS